MDTDRLLFFADLAKESVRTAEPFTALERLAITAELFCKFPGENDDSKF